MTDVKQNPTTEALRPVDKVVEPVATPRVEVPATGDKNPVKPIEDSKTDGKGAPPV